MTDKIGKYLNCVVDYVEGGGVIGRLGIATEQARFDFLDRVFDVEGSKDSEGKGLGGYSNPYAKIRDKAGLTTGRKTLEFTGDLKRSIESDIGVKDNTIEIFISDKGGDLSQRKAGYINELQKNKRGNAEVFRLKEETIDKIFQEADILITKDINDIANDCV